MIRLLFTYKNLKTFPKIERLNITCTIQVIWFILANVLSYTNIMTCSQCNKESKYKCPTCFQPYCSVDCYKAHKQNPCARPPDPPKENITDKPATEYEYPTDDSVPLDKLKLLEQSSEVRKCLENPHVRNILELLDKSPYPDEMIQEYMQEPIFTEFVDACLNVVQLPEENK